jgi:hypothetical protein
MTEVAKLSTTIEVNKIDETLKKLRGFSGSVDETQKKMDEISRKPAKVNVQVDNADKALQSLMAFSVAGVAVSQVANAAVDFTKQSVALASAAEETGSKFKVVFGAGAAAAENELSKFGDQANRSKLELMGMAASIQDTLVPLGYARDDAQGLSIDLVRLATDVASFNNSADADVMRDFQSAIVGNTETVRKYGIVITQATLDQELLRMGVKGGVNAATEMDKAQARLNLLYKGTADAQGDAIRTADSYANSTKGLTGAVDELKIAIGNGLMPQMAQVKSSAIPIVKTYADVIEEFNKVNQEMKPPQWMESIPTLNKMIFSVATLPVTAPLLQAKTEYALLKAAFNLLSGAVEDTGEKTRNAAADLYHWGSAAEEANGKARDLTNEMIAINLSAQEGGDLWNQAAQDLQAYKDEMDGAQAKARDMAVAQSELAESLKWANNMQIAKTALDDLDQSLKDGKITGDEYKEAAQNLQLSFGMATPASIALSENIANITKAYEQGLIPAEKLDEAIRNMNKDAQDGNVDIASVLESAGAPAESVNLFVEGLENAKRATEELVNTEGSVSDSAGFVDEAMQVLAERYVVHGQETDILKGRVSALAETYATLEKNILRVLAAQKKVNTNVGTNTGTTDTGKASGADFIVPPGYPHDSYRMNVQSGERVIVIPANERASGSGGGGSVAVYGNLIIQTAGVSPADVISQLSVT